MVIITKKRFIFLLTVFLFFAFYNIRIVFAANPLIKAVIPTTATTGQTLTIFGENLTDQVRLKFPDGKTLTITGSIDSGLTEVKFDIPAEAALGAYTVGIVGPNGVVESPQKININTGGKAFSSQTPAAIPTQGLPGFGQLISIIFTWSLSVLGIVVFVMIFYAGFKWFTAAGNTARVNEAKSQITNAITGAIILLAAYIILYTLNPDLVGGVLTLPGVGTTTTQNGPGGGNQPPYTGTQPPNILADVTAERAKYGAAPNETDLGKILNAVAWKNKNAGWGLSGKNFGTRCPSPAGEIACDILHHKPTNVIVDVFVAAGDGGPTTPAWQVIGPPPGTNRPWVAPVQP
ncbi:MAG: pilin [Patescibacteria group bacterium]